MTFKEIREAVMFQTNNDAEDLGEFEPCLDTYINEGYDKLIEAYTKKHLDDDGSDYESLRKDNEEPVLPTWMHRGIVDYATYLVYRNGNVTKQNRAVPYYQLFEQLLVEVRTAGNKKTGLKHFINLYD